MRAGIKAQYLGLLHIRQAIIDYSNLCADYADHLRDVAKEDGIAF